MIEKTKENTNFVVSETSKGNSFETGATGNRWKFYFNDVNDLIIQIKELQNKGFIIENIGDLK